jgi:hypothetical protein
MLCLDLLGYVQDSEGMGTWDYSANGYIANQWLWLSSVDYGKCEWHVPPFLLPLQHVYRVGFP